MVTRKELYELVWSTPMIRVAEKFEVSGAGTQVFGRADAPVHAASCGTQQQGFGGGAARGGLPWQLQE